MGIKIIILTSAFQLLLCFQFDVFAQTDTSKGYDYNGNWVKDIVVEKGRTIYNITKSYGISEAQLNELNPELSGGLKAGMTLRVPAEKSSDKQEASQTVNPKLSGALKHVVKKKESVFGIAKMYGITVDDVYALNRAWN